MLFQEGEGTKSSQIALLKGLTLYRRRTLRVGKISPGRDVGRVVEVFRQKPQHNRQRHIDKNHIKGTVLFSQTEIQGIYIGSDEKVYIPNFKLEYKLELKYRIL